MNNFYKWKTILITWSTWFKWSWLSFWLHNLWANVIWYSLKINSEPNLFDAIKLDNKITQIIWDINDIETLEKTCNKYKPEIIFHLAAQPLVRDSYENPVYTMQTNAIWTVNILEVMRQKDYIKWAILITTDKVYHNNEWLYPYRETDRLGWFDPYSSSKAMAEIAIDSYKKSFLDKMWKKIAVVRAGNVIWWWDWSKDRLIPDIVKTIMKWDKLVLRNPNAVRPWQYVLEALFWYLIMWEKIFQDDKYCEAYNFWPDFSDTMKVVDLVEKSINILWKWKYKIEILDKNPHEAWLLLLDNTKAKTLLWWKSKYNIEEVLELTISWYKDFYDWKDMEKICLREINKFNF